MAKKRRTAAQKAATRKLIAFNRGSKRASKPKKHRRHHPVATTNPHPHKRRRTRSGNPIFMKKRRHHRKGNPISVGGLWSFVKQGSVGAIGALGIDFVMGMAPLPDYLVQRKAPDGSINYLYYATKTGAALLLAHFGKGVFGSAAETAAMGSMTVNLYDLFRSIMPAGIPLGYVNAGYPVGRPLSGASVSSRMMPGKQNRLQGSNINAKSVYGNAGGVGMYTGRALSMYTNR
jgi:hypothetical protein